MDEKNRIIQECLSSIKKDKEELAYVEKMLKDVQESGQGFQTAKKSRRSGKKSTEMKKKVIDGEPSNKEQEAVRSADSEKEIRYTQKWDESGEQSESENDEEVVSKPKRPLPIVLREQGRLSSLIRKEAEANKIRIVSCRVTKEGVKIHTETPDDFRKLRKLLEGKDVPFHTFQLNEEKALQVVLRGIPTDFSEGEVLGEPEEQGFPVLKVRRIKRFKEEMPMMLVDVKKTDDGKKLFAVKEVVGMKVKAEAKRKPTSSTQCFRCQIHPSRECPLKGKKNVNHKCANCGGQHHAAGRDCPEHPLQIKKKREEEKREKINKVQRKEGTSYSQVKIKEDKVTAPGGEVAVLVRNKLAARKVRFQDRIEAVGAAVKIEGKEVLLVSAYNRPSYDLEPESLRQLTEADHIVIGGDLNSKHPSWNSRVVNPNGKKLQQWLNQNPRIQMKAPAEHTYYPENGRRSDVLDIFLTKALPMSDAVTIMKLDSDHYPVIIELKSGFTPRRKMSRKINSMKFISLCSKLQYQEGDISKDRLENAAKQLTEDIQRVLRECEVERPVSFTDRWELNDREKALLKKYEAKQRWSRTRSVSDKRELNQLKRKVNMIARKKEEHLGKTVDGIQENPGSLWPLLTQICRLSLKKDTCNCLTYV
ncbi:zinc finger associated protein [Popillia japonica]|uniref:Zinc finger associated protein n=1 Tax=Popillia japonica TaxID=7064 RepID=A0AAW1KF35_POPJA